MRLFTWVYPKFERLAEYTAEAVERLSAMGADGIYMMAPPEVSVTAWSNSSGRTTASS